MMLDNRMGWIRNVELTTGGIDMPQNDGDRYEFEIASEQRIVGLLNYDNKLLAGLIVNADDKKLRNSLYTYSVIVKYANLKAGDFVNKEYNKRGYHFPGGPIGELVSLMALHFMARFYVITSTSGCLSVRSVPLRQQHDFVYFPPKISACPEILKEKAGLNWQTFGPFLDEVKTLPSNLHYPFIMACNLYVRSLREIGVDAEMFFIRLVSAVEAINNRLSSAQFKKMIGVDKKSKQADFISFINRFSSGFYKGGNFKAKSCKITVNKSNDYLRAIYDARSNYLHDGESMYLSGIAGYESWDVDPSGGMYIDNKEYPAKKKLPYISWFQRLVRHCLLNFLHESIVN